MTAPRKPGARDVWKAIDDAGFEEEVGQVAAMRDEEIEAELLKAGFEEKDFGGGGAERAGAGASMGASAGAGADTGTGTGAGADTAADTGTGADTGAVAGADSGAGAPSEEKRRDDWREGEKRQPARKVRHPLRTRVAVWLSAATLAVGVIALFVTADPIARNPSPEHANGAALRGQAKEACARAEWRTCLDRLDEADRVDPRGAGEAAFLELRKQAEEGVWARKAHD
jgi:hypothetical protein